MERVLVRGENASTWRERPELSGVGAQACILAVGGTQHNVVIGEGGLEDRPILTVTLSSDARVVDGDVAGAFLKSLAAHLHNAAALLVQN